MERVRLFYTEEELRGALIYDAYGWLFGYICGFDYSERGARLRACIRVSAGDRIPDREGLAVRLREQGVPVSGDEGLAELVAKARRFGVEIPFRAAEREGEMFKGYVEPEELAALSVVEGEGGFGLLLEPREAIYRGTLRAPPEPRPVPERLRGKPLLSGRLGYLGRVVAIVFTAGGIGVRAARRTREALDWLRLIDGLREAGYVEAARRLLDEYGPTRLLPGEAAGALKAELEKLGVPDAERLVQRYMLPEGRVVVDVHWDRLCCAGDAVVADTETS